MSYETEAHRADAMRQTAIDPEIGEYWHGYRIGIVDSRGCPDGRPEMLAAVAPLRSGDVDRLRAARADGYVDGLLWAERGRRSGLVRLAIRRSGLSARHWAERELVRDERTVRRWVSGEVAIPDVALRRIDVLLNGRND